MDDGESALMIVLRSGQVKFNGKVDLQAFICHMFKRPDCAFWREPMNFLEKPAEPGQSHYSDCFFSVKM